MNQLLRNTGFKFELRGAIVNQQIVLYRDQRVCRRLMIAPLDDDVTGDAQQVRLWIAHFAQVARAEQSQVGFLSQVFDIDGGSHSPAQESEKAPIPALLPPCEHLPI
jgi:hypothetical protein